MGPKPIQIRNKISKDTFKALYHLHIHEICENSDETSKWVWLHCNIPEREEQGDVEKKVTFDYHRIITRLWG